MPESGRGNDAVTVPHSYQLRRDVESNSYNTYKNDRSHAEDVATRQMILCCHSKVFLSIAIYAFIEDNIAVCIVFLLAIVVWIAMNAYFLFPSMREDDAYFERQRRRNLEAGSSDGEYTYSYVSCDCSYCNDYSASGEEESHEYDYVSDGDDEGSYAYDKPPTEPPAEQTTQPPATAQSC